MTTRVASLGMETVRVAQEARPIGGIGFDWIVTGLCTWFLGGLYLDGWAHTHIPELETFFTPWHGVLYSGFFAVAGFLSIVSLRNRLQGFHWLRALPAGYELSLLGAIIFFVGGLGDMVWHTLFGIEVDVQALYSPTHLVLALGGGLIVSGPLRAAWRRSQADRTSHWAEKLPAIFSLAFTLSVFTFFTMVIHPFVNPRAAGYVAPSGDIAFYRQALGVAGVLLQVGLMMGVILLAVRRWVLPLGSLTLLLTLNAFAMHFLDHRDDFWFVLVALLAGLMADLLLYRLKPLEENSGAFRLFAFTVPFVFYLLYFIALMLTRGVWWTIHLWAGSIVLAGFAGWLMSYAILPPQMPKEPSR